MFLIRHHGFEIECSTGDELREAVTSLSNGEMYESTVVPDAEVADPIYSKTKRSVKGDTLRRIWGAAALLAASRKITKREAKQAMDVSDALRERWLTKYDNVADAT